MSDRSELRPILEDLERLRDEIRVQLHLAGMDAKTEWALLRPELQELEHSAEGVAQETYEATRELAGDLRQVFRAFRDRLRTQRERERPK